MNPELRQFIEQTQFRHAVVQQVVNLLPADDAELDELLAEVVVSNNLKWFMYVFVAAAGEPAAYVGALRLKRSCPM